MLKIRTSWRTEERSGQGSSDPGPDDVLFISYLSISLFYRMNLILQDFADVKEMKFLVGKAEAAIKAFNQ
jgi:CRISPR/Cas system CMR subunit Cmr4 (Cas7 group RAMP superfamily)